MGCSCEQLAAELAAIKLLLQNNKYTDDDAINAINAQLGGIGGLPGLTASLLGLKILKDELQPLNLPQRLPQLERTATSTLEALEQSKRDLLNAILNKADKGEIASLESDFRNAQEKFNNEIKIRTQENAANAIRVERLQRESDQFRQSLSEARSEFSQLKGEVRRLTDRAVDLQNQYNNAVEKWGATDARTKAIAGELETAKLDLRDQRQKLDRFQSGVELAQVNSRQALDLGKSNKNELDGINTNLQRVDTKATRAESSAGTAMGNAATALDQSRTASQESKSATQLALKTREVSDSALDTAKKASGKADDVSRGLGRIASKADEALGQAGKALGKAGQAIQDSGVAKKLAQFADSNAGKALGQVANVLMIVAGISAVVDFLMSIYNEIRLGNRVNQLEQRITFEENLSSRIMSALTRIDNEIDIAIATSNKAMAQSESTSNDVRLLNNRFSELRTELDKKIRDLRTLIDAALANFNRLQAEINAYVASIPKVIDEKISAAVTGLKSAYDKALALLEQKITELQKELAAMGDIANQVISAINPRLTAIEQQLKGLGTGSNPTDINPVLAAINSAKSEIIRNLEPLLDRAGYYNKTTITEQTLGQIREQLQQAQREVAELRSGVFFGNLAKQDTTAIRSQLNDALQRLNILRDKSELNHNVITTTVTNQNASLSGQVQQLTQTVTTTTPTQNPTTTNQGINVTDIINPVNLAMGVAFADLGRQLIQRIDTKTAQIPAQVIPPIINATANNVGTCRYDAARVNRIDQNTDEVEGLIRDTNLRTRKIDATTTATAGAVAAHATSWFGWVNNVWGQFYNQFVKVRDWLLNDRVINILNLIFNLHNAMMLSSNVAQSIIWAVDGVLRLLGVELKDSEGNDIGLSQRISQTITNLANQAFGEENVAEAKAQFALLSTIYRSAVNVIYGVTGLFQSMRMVVDTIAEYVGRIGNALKRDAVVADNNYQWMREDFWSRIQDTTRFEKFYRGVENTETVTGTVSMVTSDIQSVSDTVRSFDDQRDQIVAEAKRAQDALGDVDPSTFTRSGTGYSQDSPLPADTVVATEAEAAIASEPRVSLTDPEIGKP